jgi:hypothetical protein
VHYWTDGCDGVRPKVSAATPSLVAAEYYLYLSRIDVVVRPTGPRRTQRGVLVLGTKNRF